MSKTLVAVVDTVFPTLDPARSVLAKVDAELVMAEQPTPDSIPIPNRPITLQFFKPSIGRKRS